MGLIMGAYDNMIDANLGGINVENLLAGVPKENKLPLNESWILRTC